MKKKKNLFLFKKYILIELFSTAYGSLDIENTKEY